MLGIGFQATCFGCVRASQPQHHSHLSWWLSRAVEDAKQHPWLLPTRCQQHTALSQLWQPTRSPDIPPLRGKTTRSWELLIYVCTWSLQSAASSQEYVMPFLHSTNEEAKSGNTVIVICCHLLSSLFLSYLSKQLSHLSFGSHLWCHLFRDAFSKSGLVSFSLFTWVPSAPWVLSSDSQTPWQGSRRACFKLSIWVKGAKAQSADVATSRSHSKEVTSYKSPVTWWWSGSPGGQNCGRPAERTSGGLAPGAEYLSQKKTGVVGQKLVRS